MNQDKLERLTAIILQTQSRGSGIFDLRTPDEDEDASVFQLGLEQLLGVLDVNMAAYDSNRDTRQIQFLAERVLYDVETAIENLTVHRFAVVSDLMRDVMETEYLVRDFWLQPERIHEWLQADRRTLQREYGAGALRKRYADYKCVAVETLGDTEDYKLHSEHLHVTPAPRLNDLLGRGRTSNHEYSTALCLAEIFEHSRRYVTVSNALGSKLVGSSWNGPTEGGIDGLKIALATANKNVAIFVNAEMRREVVPCPVETRQRHGQRSSLGSDLLPGNSVVVQCGSEERHLSIPTDATEVLLGFQ